MRQPPRAVVLLVFAVGLSLSLVYLQSLFDRADEKKALNAVLTYVPGGGLRSIGDALLFAGPAPQCAATFVSRLRGELDVTCAMKPGAPDARFRVVLGAPAPVPLEPNAQRLLDGLLPAR